jgi:hypothetical protein
MSKFGTDKEVRVYTKGAPDMLFKYTNKVITEYGVQDMFDDSTVSNELL